MGFRFRKSTKIGPFRLNFSKSGVGWSVGGKGFRYTKKANGGTRTTLSVPGTGISYVKESKPSTSKRKLNPPRSTEESSSSSHQQQKQSPQPPHSSKSYSTAGWIAIAFSFLLIPVVSAGLVSSFLAGIFLLAADIGMFWLGRSFVVIARQMESKEYRTDINALLYLFIFLQIALLGICALANLEEQASTSSSIAASSVSSSQSTAEPTPEPTPEPTAEPTPEPTATPAPTPYQTQAAVQDSSEPMVWISKSGKKYHRTSDCSGMKNPTQISLSKAQSRNMEPCEKCY